MLNKGILMQDWVFRLGLRSFCPNIYTLTRRLVGESRFGKEKKTCESEWGHLIFQDQPLASLVKMGSFGLFPFLQIHSRSSDIVFRVIFQEIWKKEKLKV